MTIDTWIAKNPQTHAGDTPAEGTIPWNLINGDCGRDADYNDAPDLNWEADRHNFTITVNDDGTTKLA